MAYQNRPQPLIWQGITPPNTLLLTYHTLSPNITIIGGYINGLLMA